jgi:hypothetical protein
MALSRLEYSAGVNKDDTPLSAEGGWTDADKVRFVRGKPETIGGWDPVLADTFEGIGRGGHAWTDIEGRSYLAWGTAEKLYAYASGTIFDITPLHSTGVISNPFSTTNGSATVTVAHPDHNLETGQFVDFTNINGTVGGLNLNGGFTITVSDGDNYSFSYTGGGTATSTTSLTGGTVDFKAYLVAGLVDATGEPGGYGSGEYSEGGYGGSVLATDTLPRVWHLDNWGENLLALPRGGGLYEWQPSLSYDELVTNGDFASATGWTTGTGWSIGGGVATATAGTASTLSRPISLEAGKTYVAVFTITRTAGSVAFGINNIDVGDASTPISHSGTFTRIFTTSATTTPITFFKDAGFAGTIDNVSVTLYDKAYRIEEAPPRSDAMFVDPNRIVVLIGTSLYNVSESDGHDPYNQMAIRTSDRENNRQWTVQDDNLASDYLLAVGGRAISGLATRAQNLLWTDSALYTMQFTGDLDEPFTYSLAGTGCGLGGPLAKAEHNGAAFWMSKDNFFLFGGSIPSPIPSTVRRDTFEHIAALQQDKIVAGINPGFSEVWWFYPDSRDGNECSRYVAFKWEGNGEWTCGTFNRSTWIKPGVFDYPIALGTDGVIYYQEKGQTAGGSALVSYLEGSYSDLDDGENLTTLLRILPDFEGQTGSVDFDVYLKSFPNSTEVHKGTYTAAPNTEKIDLRAKGRLMKVKLSASSSPSFWRLGSLRADIKPSGERR